MNTIFEEPKHLTTMRYQWAVRAFELPLIVYGLAMSAMVLIALWRKAEAGLEISVLNWILGATAGFWAVGLIRLGLRLDMSRRRYVEFRDGSIFLARRGLVRLRRFVSWSLSPDPVDLSYTRLKLTYKYGFGRKHWTMLLDDDKQIAELRDALTLQIPQKQA